MASENVTLSDNSDYRTANDLSNVLPEGKFKAENEECDTNSLPTQVVDAVDIIISQNEDPQSLKNDLLFMLLIVILNECGFTSCAPTQSQFTSNTCISPILINSWKTDKQVYSVKFIWKKIGICECKLVGRNLGNIMLINLVIPSLNNLTFTTCISVDNYVGDPFVADKSTIFNNLKNLCLNFKNEIVTPAHSYILRSGGYISASLLGLDEDSQIKILIMLPVRSVLNVMQTCTSLKTIAQSQLLWKGLLLRDFPGAETQAECDYVGLYKNAFLEKRDRDLRQTIRPTGTMHDLMEYADYRSYIENPLWDFYNL